EREREDPRARARVDHALLPTQRQELPQLRPHAVDLPCRMLRDARGGLAESGPDGVVMCGHALIVVERRDPGEPRRSLPRRTYAATNSTVSTGRFRRACGNPHALMTAPQAAPSRRAEPDLDEPPGRDAGQEVLARFPRPDEHDERAAVRERE